MDYNVFNPLATAILVAGWVVVILFTVPALIVLASFPIGAVQSLWRRRTQQEVEVAVRCPDSDKVAHCTFMQNKRSGRLVSLARCTLPAGKTCDAACLVQLNRVIVPTVHAHA